MRIAAESAITQGSTSSEVWFWVNLNSVSSVSTVVFQYVSGSYTASVGWTNFPASVNVSGGWWHSAPWSRGNPSYSQRVVVNGVNLVHYAEPAVQYTLDTASCSSLPCASTMSNSLFVGVEYAGEAVTAVVDPRS